MTACGMQKQKHIFLQTALKYDIRLKFILNNFNRRTLVLCHQKRKRTEEHPLKV